MKKIIWGRVAYVWIIWALIVFNLTCLLVGCDVAEAGEALPVPVATIIGECANCSDEGMIAVGNVIRNRARLRGQTVEEVCLARLQFSFWNDRDRANKFIKNANDLTINRAWSAWQASATEDVTFGSDHYFADYIATPKWARGMTFIRAIGRHRFYRA